MTYDIPFLDALKPLSIAAIFITSLLLVLFSARALCAAANYYITESNYVRVVDITTGKKIYEGRKACINLKSLGSHTQVKIRTPFLWCSMNTQSVHVGNYSLTNYEEETKR